MINLETPDGSRKILLHCCCAPCSSAILEALEANGITPVLFYSNSNIYPREEYDHRESECVRYAGKLAVEIVEDEYDHEQWLSFVKGLEAEPERGGRCEMCFKFRLRRAFEYAAKHGITVVATTLASSRWKSLEQIEAAGQWAEEQIPGVTFWAQNWRKGGLQDRRNQLLKENNFYNQLYCGCEFSMR